MILIESLISFGVSRNIDSGSYRRIYVCIWQHGRPCVQTWRSCTYCVLHLHGSGSISCHVHGQEMKSYRVFGGAADPVRAPSSS